MAEKSLIESIKILRDRTGAGMMDCKKALEESNNDIEAAVDWLRKKGIAKASQKSTRIAAEGLALVKVCPKCKDTAVILEVNSETDFVSRSDAFKDLVNSVADIILDKRPANIESANEVIKDLITDATVKIGEKLSLRRFEIVTIKDGQTFGSYIHMGGKIAVLVVTDSKDETVNKGLAMHIAAEAPNYIRTEDIPAAIREHEATVQRELALQDEKIMAKPEEMREKIITNKINSALNESVLLEQGYLLKDGKEKVGKSIGNTNVISFVRYKVGEGMEKRQDNFAEEVMSQIK